MAPFQSGLLGYVGYEALAALETSLDLPPSPHLFAPAIFGVYDAAAVFARNEERAWIIGRTKTACEHLEASLGEEETALEPVPDFEALLLPEAVRFVPSTIEAAFLKASDELYEFTEEELAVD